MTRDTTAMTGSTVTVADRLVRLEAEVANLPVDIEAAEIAGDETRLASLLARERILARQVAATQREALEAEIADMAVAVNRVGVEKGRAMQKLRDFELAAKVYDRAVKRCQAYEVGPAEQRFNGLQARLFKLQDRLEGMN